MGHGRIVWDGGALLGEGPVWDGRDDSLWFVDIKGRHVHRVDPESGASRSWLAPAQIGWVVPAVGGGFVAGLQTGLHRFDPDEDDFQHLADVEPDLSGNRLNDATVDPDGMIWFGSMDDGERAVTGRIYRWDGNSVQASAIPAVPITNGPAIAPDGATLYHVDTLGGVIHAAALIAGSDTGGTREFVRIAPEDGYPDGVTTDSAGNVWVGLWGGHCARCYAPDGTLLRQVELPAANITKIALGGKDGRTAFATSARIGLDEAALAAQPHAGAVFAFDVDVPGRHLPLART
ncbi:SMP-30/gluconolactonase/LRE family protein [Novosphingopyxis sp.]|uniref:SMP-30/gluconolactonase/LRE family protein n=1 Tax=Novosphingopyxis sp. TaxID=2709690 RepID=UPI003B5BFB64